MTSKRSLRIETRILPSSVLFIAVLTILTGFAAPAQQADVRQPSPKVRRQGNQVNKASSSVPGSGSSLFLPAVTYYAGAGATVAAVVADVNGDGKADLVVGDQNCPNSDCSGGGLVSVLLGNGDGTFQPAVVYGSGGEWVSSLAVADVNGDGKLDVVVANYLDTTVGVLFGNGDGTFQPAALYNAGTSSVSSVAVTDLNGDSKPDIVVASNNGTVSVMLGNGSGTFQPGVQYRSLGARSVAVGDVNRDGKPDLVVAGSTSVSIVNVLLGNGDGTFQSAVTYPSGGLPGGWANWVAVADLNADGKLDLVAANFPDSTVAVLLGNGDGTFQPAVLYSSGAPTAWSVAIADMNGDGKPDVAVADFSGTVGVLLGNGDGSFQPALTFNVPGDAASVVLADLNGDGRPDLVLSNGNDFVSVLLNNAGTESPTTTRLLSSLNPSIYGQSVTFTATVSSSTGTPAGTVELYHGSIALGSGTLTGGKTLITVSSLPAGSDSITASYPGVGTFAPSASTPLAQIITSATTITSMASSQNPASTDQSIAFTATVSGQFGGAAAGSVTFFSGSQTLGTASLSGNRAILTTSFTTAGTYSIFAKYNGDGNNSGSTSSTLSQVIRTATTTMLASSLNPSLAGQAVTFTANVTSTVGTPPNGELVTFKNGSAVLGAAPLSGGTTSLTTSSLVAGIYTITAAYSGDANFVASTSNGLRQVVNSTSKSATATALTSNLNPSIYGQKITWTAAVTTSGALPPTGKVNFTWGGGRYSFGTATLNSSGLATLTRSLESAGSYQLTAVYSGDANNLGSTSAALNQVITEATTSATLSSSPNRSTSGQSVTFTATIASPTIMPTGPVTFTAGKTVLGTAQLSGGKAKFTTSTLPVGANRVTVNYYGDSNISGSSASVTQTVQP
jgi:uncharacterized protein YycO